MDNTSRQTTSTPTTPALGLRRAEAAKAIGISERKLDELKASGRVPFVQIDGCIIFPVEALRQWLADQVKGGEAAP